MAGYTENAPGDMVNMGNALPKATCLLANGDLRPGLLVSISDPCLQNNIPVYGDCGAANLSETTWDFGAAAQVVLGGIPEADYPVTVKVGDLPAAVVTVASKPFGNCDGDSLPEDALVLKSINLSDQFGNIIDAAAAGSTVPLKARLYMLSEGGVESSRDFDCFPGTDTCPVLLGNRVFSVDTGFETASVSIDGQASNAIGNGFFELPDFKVGEVAGKKTVTITGKGSKSIRKTVGYCSAAADCSLQPVLQDLSEISLTKEVYAVDINLPKTTYFVPIDEDGYALTDTVLGYTILPHVPGKPAESYTAGTAMVRIAQRQADGALEPLAYLDTEPSGPGFATLARGFNFDPEGEYVAQVILNHGSNGGEIVSREMVLTPSVVEIGMNPDYNRDGFINEQDQGLVTPETPWRFWVNDDDDKTSDALSGLGGDDTPGAGQDCQDDAVNGIRDLIDFFPLHLDIGNTLSLFSPAAGYSYVLRQVDSAVGVVETSLSVDGSNYYLEDLDVAAGLRVAPVKIVDDKGLALSRGFLETIVADPVRGVFLVEGRKESIAPLVLEVRDRNGAVVISQNFPLEVMSVAKMTGHKDLRPVAGGSGGDPSRAPVSPPYAMSEGSSKVLVWMHGYNVSPIEARATYAEVFKRFFHAGLMGKFYGVSWFGDPPDGTILPVPHYHQAAVNAFASARDFGVFVEGLDGEVYIAAHSLGNLVAGSAIQDHSLTKFNKYFVIDAAVALEAYGQSAVDEGMVTVDDWLDFWKYAATDSQGNPVSQDQKLLASEWYKLFPASDNRSQLTWRNRLDKVPSSKVYNFYSSTEEVLRVYPGDDIATVLGLLQNITALKEYLSISTWVKQEKYKGRSLTPNAGGVSSPFAGWSFSGNYWKSSFIPPDFRRHLTPEEAANEISEEALRTQPFFALDTSLLSSHGLDNLTAPDTTGTFPSDFVMKTVSGTGLAGYYTDNAPAQDRIKVRDWLLAEAFPATTLPMGANKNPVLTLREQNIDMSGVQDSNGGCCKTEEARWPGVRSGEWFHSDYKDMAYQHVYEFYKKINNPNVSQ